MDVDDPGTVLVQKTIPIDYTDVGDNNETYHVYGGLSLKVPATYRKPNVSVQWYLESDQGQRLIKWLDVSLSDFEGDETIRDGAHAHLDQLAADYEAMKQYYQTLLDNSGNLFFKNIQDYLAVARDYDAMDYAEIKNELAKNRLMRQNLDQVRNEFTSRFTTDLLQRNLDADVSTALNERNEEALGFSYNFFFNGSGDKTAAFARAEKMQEIYRGNADFQLIASQIETFDIEAASLQVDAILVELNTRLGTLAGDSQTTLDGIAANSAGDSELKSAFMQQVISMYRSRTIDFADAHLQGNQQGNQLDRISEAENFIQNLSFEPTPFKIMFQMTAAEIIATKTLLDDAQQLYESNFDALQQVFQGQPNRDVRNFNTVPTNQRTRFESVRTHNTTYHLRLKDGDNANRNANRFTTNEINLLQTVANAYQEFIRFKAQFDRLEVRGTEENPSFSIQAYDPAYHDDAVDLRHNAAPRVVQQDVQQITYQNVDQNGLGNCWLMSGTGCLAQYNAGEEAANHEIFGNANSIIQRNGEHYDVRLYTYLLEGEDYQVVPVTIRVEARFVIDGAANEVYSGAGANGQGLFAQLIEKAAAQLYGSYQNIVGGWHDVAWRLLRGGQSVTYKLGDMDARGDDSTLNRALTYINAFRAPEEEGGEPQRLPLIGVDTGTLSEVEGLQVIAQRGPAGEQLYQLPDNPPMPARRIFGPHAYHVADINADGHFLLVNPHNTPNQAGGQSFWVTPQELDQFFENMTIYDQEAQEAFFEELDAGED